MALLSYQLLFLTLGILKSQQVLCSDIASTTCDGEANVLSLLALLPYPATINNSTTDWDRGMEMISAAELAVKSVNMSSILPGFRLKLVPSGTEVCKETVFPETLASFARYAVDLDCSVVGIVGLLCPSVTDVVSRLAGRPEVSLLQVSAGVSPPSFRNDEEYPGLYRIISSSAVYNKALISIMKEFQWMKVSMFFDNQQVYYTGTRDDFVERINDENFDLSLTVELSAASISQVFEDLQTDRLRISYGSMRVDEAALVMCEAYRRSLLWPNYVWIFHDHTVEDLILNSPCGNESITLALEGVFLFRHRLKTDNDTQLVSGRKSMDEFPDNSQLTENIYSRAVYDSIWAFALALNNSLPILNQRVLQQYSFGNNEVTNVIESEIQKLSFAGATGHISFSKTTHEASTTVDIYQVDCGEAVHRGVYNSTTDVLNLSILPTDVPRDHFENRSVTISLGLRCVALTAAVLLFILTTVSLIMFIVFLDTPEIKAASPILSTVIFIGCYFLSIASVLTSLRDFAIQESNTTPYTVICNAELWFATLGIKLIFSTLFVRLLRVYRIFFNYNKMGKFWSNSSMMLMILCVVFPSIIVLLLWTVFDPLHTDRQPTVFRASGDPPFFETSQSCSSEYLAAWLTLLLAYGSIILCFLVGLAIKTRKVTLDTFRDTRAVNTFIFMTAIILGVCIPFTILFTTSDGKVAGFVLQFLAILLTGALCQGFLFGPKFFIPLLEKAKRTPVRRKSFADTGYSSNIPL